MNLSGPRRSLRVALLAASLLTGCIDLVPVEPPPERDARFSVSMALPEEIASGESGTARVTATLDPGVARTGIDRGVVNDTMVVMGQPRVPADVSGLGLYRYDTEVWVGHEELIERGIDIEPPILEGIVPEGVSIRWPIATRVGADSITVEAGSDLVLRLHFARRFSRPRPESRHWSVTIFRGEEYVSRGGLGLPPTEISLPSDLLGPAGAELTAIVNITQSGKVRAESRDFVTQVEVSQRVEWRVSLAKD